MHVKNKKIIGFTPFNVIDDKVHGVYGVGYNDSNKLLMLIIYLNDEQKSQHNSKYEIIYYSGVPKSLAMSMIEGKDFDCFYACLFSCKYNVEDYDYCN